MIGELEAVAAQGWRAPEEALLGDWLLRAAQGFSGRANSALATGDPGLPLAEAVTRVRAWYAARGLPAMIAVPHPLDRPGDSPADRFLHQQGWRVRRGPAVVMTAPAAAVAAPAAQVDLAPEPGQDWLKLYHDQRNAPLPVVRHLLMSAADQRFASVRRGGNVVAIGRVALTGDWGGLTAVAVHPGYRRTGLATAITAALASAAVRHGATRLYLQVEAGNQAARALYARSGFTAHHAYHYRTEPSA